MTVPDPDPLLGWGPRPAGYLGKWPPVCGECGHRHIPDSPHADHTWRDSCPYDAGPHCPETVPVDDDRPDGLLADLEERDEREPAVLPTTYLAVCHPCGTQHGGEPISVPFSDMAGRDRWAGTHADVRTHTVTLAEQQPSVGTTITGYATPTAVPGGPVKAAAAPAAPPPLLAFVVPAGGRPDLMCRVPNRAGAAWLAHAAHACLLGRQGSTGIDTPHRVMYIGRVTDPTDAAGWRVRIDGLIGATGKLFGQPIGDEYGITATATLPMVEDAVEAIIDDEYKLGRHTFSVLLVADLTPNPPPDPVADNLVRNLMARPKRDGMQFGRDDPFAPPAPEHQATRMVCCELHNATCEPSSLCCRDCPEFAHPAHPTGMGCVLGQ